MNSQDITSVHVDFELTHGELFRVNLDLIKWRLIAGILVAANPIAALISFFIFIDEVRILLQLSPLIIGAPVVAVGAQVLRLYAVCRKFVSTLPVSQRRTHYFFQPEMDGYDLSYGESFSHVAWKDVSKAIERPEYFVLYLSSFEPRIVPKKGFHIAADVRVLRNILCTKLGARARMLNH